MKTLDIEYHADGARLVGFFAADDTRAGRRPGILVAPEGGGLSDITRQVALRLASLGYAAFAMDYYGDGKPLDSINDAMPRIQAFMAEPATIRARASAALKVLTEQAETDPTRLAATGYCFGGTTALELARSGADLQAVVGFHSGLATVRPQDARNIKARVLVCIGGADPFVPPEQQRAFEKEMTDGGVDWRMNLYGGVGHSFTNPDVGVLNRPGFEYHALTDNRSWRAMRDLFDEVWGPL